MPRQLLRLSAASVLTNGFADNVLDALNAIGLSGAFRALVDTRGTALVAPFDNPRLVNTDEVFSGVGQYYKFEFVNSFLFDHQRALQNGLSLSTKGVGHVVYVVSTSRRA